MTDADAEPWMAITKKPAKTTWGRVYEPVELDIVDALPAGARPIALAASDWGYSRANVRRLIHAGRVKAVHLRTGDDRERMPVYVLTKDKPGALDGKTKKGKS